MKTKLILPVCAGLLGIVLPTAGYLQWNHWSDSSSGSVSSNLPQETSRKGERPLDSPRSSEAMGQGTAWAKGFDPTLEAALTQTDPSRRTEALQQWADGVGPNAMDALLTKLNAIEDSQLRAEIRGALLASWAERDVKGMLDWFGKRKAEDELHQQARHALVEDFGERDPTAMLSWMEHSLPESVRAELYGPFFQQWAKTDPAAAAGKLRQLADASQANPAEWNEMVGQVVAVWAGTDLNGALAWIQSLPEGATKLQALTEISYRWTEVSPQAAAAYAARENDPALLKLVAGKWAEKDPQSAAAWAAKLPPGQEQDDATVNAAVVWAQKDPAAAAAYATSLPTAETREQAVMAVISAWSQTAPAQAAAWVQQLPENTARSQAMGQLMGTWAGTDAAAASQWLKTLSPSASRDYAVAAYDNAVGVYSSALSATSPAIAFQSAGTISNETLRNRSLQEIATTWLNQDPVAAQRKIVQSSLPAKIKSQLLDSASRSRQ